MTDLDHLPPPEPESALTVTPLTVREARAYVGRVHRHHLPPQGGLFAIAAALDTQHDGRLPRLIERYLPGQGIAPDDYIVIRGADWLAWYGRDE